jgi:hypothetical protein
MRAGDMRNSSNEARFVWTEDDAGRQSVWTYCREANGLGRELTRTKRLKF